MRVLAFALMLVPAMAFADDRDLPAPAEGCKPRTELAADPQGLRAEPLNRQPRAEAYYTVQRIEDGCDTPVKVREYRRGQR